MEQAKLGFFGRIIRNITTSWHLTMASLRLVTTYPKVLALPFYTLGTITLLVVLPLMVLTRALSAYPEGVWAFFKALYFISVAAAENGNWSLAITSFVVESYLIWCLWMIPVLTAVLYFCTVGMHAATMQIKQQTPDMKEAFGVANRNFKRILLLAAFNATIYTWLRYIVFYVIGAIPLAGRWILAGIRLVLTAVTYLMLPIVIYEEAGARNAFRSAWKQVKKTWSGLLIGTGLVFSASFALFEIFVWGVASHVVGGAGAAILTLIGAALIFSIATAAAAALRACLYWYATTGEVPPGFSESQFPTISERGRFTGSGLGEPEPATSQG